MILQRVLGAFFADDSGGRAKNAWRWTAQREGRKLKNAAQYERSGLSMPEQFLATYNHLARSVYLVQ